MRVPDRNEHVSRAYLPHLNRAMQEAGIDRETAFVTNETAAMVGVIDTAKHKVASTITFAPIKDAPTPPRPMGGALSPDGQQVFISLGRSGAVAAIDVAGRKVVRTIEGVGARPWGIALNTDGTKLYTANGPSGDVSIVDVASGKVEKKVPTEGSPWGVVYVEKR